MKHHDSDEVHARERLRLAFALGSLLLGLLTAVRV